MRSLNLIAHLEGYCSVRVISWFGGWGRNEGERHLSRYGRDSDLPGVDCLKRV